MNKLGDMVALVFGLALLFALLYFGYKFIGIIVLVALGIFVIAAVIYAIDELFK